MSEALSKTSWAVWALAPVLTLGPALTCGIPRVMAPLFIISTLAAVIADAVQRRTRPVFDKNIAGLLGAFLVFGAVSYLWTVNPDDTFGKIAQLLGIWGPLAFFIPVLTRLSGHDFKRIGLLAVTGFGVGALVYANEMFNDFPFYNALRPGNEDPVDVKLNKATVLLCLWLYAAFPYFVPRQSRTRRGIFAAALAIAAYLTFQSESQSAQAILTGIPVLALFISVIPARFSAILTLSACIVLTVAMPVISYNLYHHTNWRENPQVRSSLKARIEIWEQATRRTLETPVLGWGLDSSPMIPNRGEKTFSGKDLRHLHPHNGPMQIWQESGAVGVTMLCALFGVFYRRIRRMTDTSAQKYAVFIWASTYLYTLTIWGLWQTWFAATLTLMGVMAYAGARFIALTPAQNKTAA